MKRTLTCTWILALTLGIPTTFAAPADEAPTVDMKLIPEKAVETITRSYMPRPLALKADEPTALKKKPAMEAPLFGEIKFGGKDYIVALDDTKEPKLYVDSNADGDLTLFGDTVEEMSGWAGFQPESPREKIPNSGLLSSLITPHRNSLRSVGRNDPCPCGSGKKFKKCCLNAAAEGASFGDGRRQNRF